MKKVLLVFIMLIISVSAFCENKPLCLIYPPELYKNATEDDSLLVINTLKDYLNRTNKLESLTYTVEMPSLLLAIKEGKLTSEESAESNRLDAKLKVAQVLGYDYLFLLEITREDETFEINLNVYDVKKKEMQSYGAVTRTNIKKFSSDLNSAVSSIVVQLIRGIFNENANFSSNEEIKKEEKHEEEVNINDLKPKDLIKLGDTEFKAENYTQAIFFYKKAIDKSPDEPKYRLKLAEAYYNKQLYKEALDQFYNALNMGYRGENLYDSLDKGYNDTDLLKLKEKYESRVRAEEYVTPASELNNSNDEEIVLVPPQVDNKASEYNKKIEDALGQADAKWKSGKSKDALKCYTEIINNYPKDYRAYERMVLLYANSKHFSQAADVLKIMKARGVDFDKSIVNQRIKTLSAIISAYYMGTIKELQGYKDTVIANQGNTELVTNLRIKSDKIYEVSELLNVLSNQTQSFYITNMKLTGNLINEAIAGYVDYLEVGDYDGINSSENLLEQASLRIEKIKY